jgi:hypothetical protein
MTEKKLSLAQEIVSILKDNADETPEGYTGAEWIEAADLISQLPKKTVLAIPWCAWDIELDEFGEAILEPRYDNLGYDKALGDDGEIDPDWQPRARREARYDILAILIWIPMKREEPEITLDAVKGLMNNTNIKEIVQKVYVFWGIPAWAMKDQITEAEESEDESEGDQEGEADQEEVAAEVNFPE